MNEDMKNEMDELKDVVPDSSVNVGSSGNNSANRADTVTNTAETEQNTAEAEHTEQNTADAADHTEERSANAEAKQESAGETAKASNGTYQYSNPYSSSYGSNPTPGGSSDKKEKKKLSGAGKVAIAAVLVAAIGVGAGFGAYTVTANLDKSNESTKEARLNIAGDEENAGTDISEAAENNEAAESPAAESGDASESAATLQTVGNNNAVITATVTDVSDIVDEVMPSIVSVYNKYTETANYWGQTYSQEEEATGSGIIIAKTDDELLVVTNNHVVEGADELSVQFINDKTATAQIKGTDSSNDLAVIAVSLDDIDSSTLDKIKVATIGDSDKLAVGDAAIAIGNALGYGQSVTTGVISALNREITDENNNTNTFIQTDAAINPGNSGGALLNDKGEVIGINSSKIGATTVEGMGYAIPMSRAIPIIKNLMNQETKTKLAEDEQGYLGIQGVSVTSQIASAYDMPEGVYIAEIIDGTGAADSDLQQGDIIVGINGTTVSSMDELKAQLEYYAAGKEITLTVQRASDGNTYEEKTVKVTLGEKETLEGNNSSEDRKNEDDRDEYDEDDSDENEHTFGFFSNEDW